MRAESSTPGGANDVVERAGAALKRKLAVRGQIELSAPGSLARTDLKSRRVRDER